MPRPTKPVRLWIEPARYRPDGAIRNHAAWVILDGGRIPFRDLLLSMARSASVSSAAA